MIQWAHQGGAREAPSNTLRAFAEAIDRQVSDLGLELDVHRAADGVPVVIHDPSTFRTTGERKDVARTSSADLAALNAAARWRPGLLDDPTLTGPPDGYEGGPTGDCRIPTLTDVLDLRRERAGTAPVTIEVKSSAVGAPLIDVLQAREELPAGEDAVVTLVAIYPWRMAGVRARLRTLDEPRRFGLAPTALPLTWIWLRAALGVPPRSSRYSRAQLPHQALRFGGRRIVRNIHRAHVAVDVWTVDDEPTMRRMLRAGVDGIMTDRPSELARVVAAVGQPAGQPAG